MPFFYCWNRPLLIPAPTLVIFETGCLLYTMTLSFLITSGIDKL